MSESSPTARCCRRISVPATSYRQLSGPSPIRVYSTCSRPNSPAVSSGSRNFQSRRSKVAVTSTSCPSTDWQPTRGDADRVVRILQLITWIRQHGTVAADRSGVSVPGVRRTPEIPGQIRK